ncbi:hypothetical protein LZ198_21910 [Myxococcus sp. K15C18031901]|uniref:hypothetical protein n=1 Tax=Myxococcus dinghuensis TaxID=2906761 RepID=UPI0020A78A8A|nr:hypothetical protein [Myxococcus dinghuensis]MCP3101535.1 hypothetical protein [Myxococcus dinghuensis]
MLYPTVLWLHSWLRWGVVLLVLFAVSRSLVGWLRGRERTRGDRLLQVGCVSAFDLQMLLGMLLYFGLSPFTPVATGSFRANLAVPALRFFSVEHPTVMLLALAAAHVGSALGQRAEPSARRHRLWALGLLVAMALVAVGIPWAGLSHGRPLFRSF